MKLGLQVLTGNIGVRGNSIPPSPAIEKKKTSTQNLYTHFDITDQEVKTIYQAEQHLLSSSKTDAEYQRQEKKPFCRRFVFQPYVICLAVIS